MTAGAVADALHLRYNRPSQGREGEQYVCIEQARAGAGFAGNDGQCDFLAVNTWQSRGLTLIGHEIKVSMSDWKAELAAPEKAERFARFCRRWFVAAPASLATKIRHEVPPAWGLLSVSEAGKCRELQAAPARQPDDVSPWWWIGWLAQIDRQHKRGTARTVERLMAEERTKLREQVERDIARRREYTDSRHKALAERAKQLQEATGINLEHLGSWEVDRLANALTLVRSGFDVDRLVSQLRTTADALAGLAQEEGSGG